jgi:hypothetical protein
MRTRLHALNLLDRALAAVDDSELEPLVAALDEEAQDALASVVDGQELSVAGLRAAADKGRLNGALEGIAYALSESALDDCIEQLGDNSDNPTADQLNEVLPGLIERHGSPLVRLMLASVHAGDAPAAPILRDLLKHHETLALPPAVEKLRTAPVKVAVALDPAAEAERAAVKAKRAEAKDRKKAEARARREQAARARHKA